MTLNGSGLCGWLGKNTVKIDDNQENPCPVSLRLSVGFPARFWQIDP